MLKLREFIGGGTSRKCFVHPQDPGKCVKVAVNEAGARSLVKEARVAALVRPELAEFIGGYEPGFVETDQGPGLVCELIRDEDGAVSGTLYECKMENGIDEAVAADIREFTRRLVEHDIFFYDFNWWNFVVRKGGPRKRLVYVDLKSLNENGFNAFLNLEYALAPLARNIMFRRIKRILYRELDLPFPWEALCRKAYFRTLLVRVKLNGRPAGGTEEIGA